MAIIGFVLLLISCISSLINFILGFKIYEYANTKNWLKNISILTIVLSFASLIYLMVTGDTTVKYVAEHIAPLSAPIGYKIAAVWAGQAGGLLLWALELQLISAAISIKKQSGANMILAFIITALSTMVILNNPFAISTNIIHAGLNPILQNKMMLIHPPMLFLGYALLAIPFAVTIGALIENDHVKWYKNVKIWLVLSAIALTAGNGFGAIWAYRTFGWGGFWSWDPVENTSFVPWILSIASLHALHLSKTDGKWLRPAALSSLFAFITVIYGSFLARSGLLAGASVHAYVKGEQLLLITLSTLLITSVISTIFFVYLRWNSWFAENMNNSIKHRLTVYGTITLYAIAILVLVGMTLPIFHLSPRTEIYNLFIAPCALLFSIFMLIQYQSNRIIIWSSIPISLITIFILMPEWIQQDMHPLSKLQAFIDILLLSTSITIILGSFFQLITRKVTFSASAIVSHFGIMLIIIGTIISGHQNGKVDHFITSGTSFKYAGEIITINEVWEKDGARIVEVANRNKIHDMSITEDSHFNMSLRKACIIPVWWGDVYITPQEILLDEIMMSGKKMPTGAMITVTAKPGIRLVWIGLIIIAIGLLLTLIITSTSSVTNH
jgi:cytochrome c-type biogenesis protein CcmF